MEGYRLCLLLLDEGSYESVCRRAHEEMQRLVESDKMLDFAFAQLVLRCAQFLASLRDGTSNFEQPAASLGKAVDIMRQAGRHDHLPRGLLSRAHLRRFQKDFDAARRDIDEAFEIATRGEMRLFEADCRLEYARLYLAQGDKPKAREQLDITAPMIEEMGYHRRDAEVKELGKALSV